MNASPGRSDKNSGGMGGIFWMGVAAAALIKVLLLLADHEPNFFMGDSVAFIGTALTKWFPPQRSWTYGFFIRWFCLPFHSLAPLLIAQALAGFGICVTLGSCLRRFFGVSQGVAAAMMVACALDPLQAIYERMVMAEAFSHALLALALAGAFSYCQRPRLVVLLLLQLIFAGAMSLRLQFLLPVGLLLIVLPFVANAGVKTASSDSSWMSHWLVRAVLHSAAALIVTMGLHGAYRTAMGIKHQQPPAYSYGTSGLALVAVAPILHPEDAPSAPLAAAIRDDAAFPLVDRSLRNAQMWEPGGLVSRLEKVEGGPYRADAAENAIFRRLVRRDPVGLVLFGANSYLGYWDFRAMPEVLRTDRESGPFDEQFTALMEREFHLDVRGYPRPSLTKTLHGWIEPWLVLLLASPLLLLAAMVCAGRQKWRETSLLLMVGVVILAQNTMLSVMTTYRFVQPLTFITLMAIGVIVGSIYRRPTPTL